MGAEEREFERLLNAAEEWAVDFSDEYFVKELRNIPYHQVTDYQYARLKRIANLDCSK